MTNEKQTNRSCNCCTVAADVKSTCAATVPYPASGPLYESSFKTSKAEIETSHNPPADRTLFRLPTSFPPLLASRLIDILPPTTPN